MTKISALSPNGFTIEITCPESEADYGAWLLEADKWLTKSGFKPLPVPSYGGGNRGGNNTAPRNWIEAEGSNLYVFFAWKGKNVEEFEAHKKPWLDKIYAATNTQPGKDHELFGKDVKGYDIWTYVYSIAKGRELLEVLPADQFERRPKLQARLDAKKNG
jgi:hypothetical protein